MTNTARPVLDPQTETEIIDEIVALDWSTDPVTKPLRIIENHLGIEEEQAIALFLNLQRRNLMICRPEHMSNNMAETGVKSPVIRSRWVKWV
jgi:hypothetical protein